VIRDAVGANDERVFGDFDLNVLAERVNRLRRRFPHIGGAEKDEQRNTPAKRSHRPMSAAGAQLV
jgi:hypothetical protein